MLRTLDDGGDFSETPKSATVETVETPSKPGFDSLDSPPTGTFPKIRGIGLPELQAAAGPDWAAIEGDANALEALALALTIRRLRDRGERPADYVQPATCGGCGPVWLWPGAPARVRACPWCFNRATGTPIPRP